MKPAVIYKKTLKIIAKDTTLEKDTELAVSTELIAVILLTLTKLAGELLKSLKP